jgi:hypothetical protein
MSAAQHNALVRAIESLRPGEKWSLNGDTYADLVWLDVTTKPTAPELQAENTRLTTIEGSIRNDGTRTSFITRLMNQSASDIDAWVEANITTIAAQRALDKEILKALALLLRAVKQ